MVVMNMLGNVENKPARELETSPSTTATKIEAPEEGGHSEPRTATGQ